MIGWYRCDVRDCPRTRQARRSETGYFSRTCCTHRLRRSGLTSFPPQPLSISACPASTRRPRASTGHSLPRGLQATGLTDLQPAIFLAPAVVRLFRYTDPPEHFSNGSALCQQHIRFPQVIDNLFDRVTFPPHLCSRPSESRCQIPNSENGPA